MDDFDLFWAHYPRKVAKGAARKAFVQAVKKTTLDAMLKALHWQRPQWQEPKFTPHPATWLRAERWDDEPPRQMQKDADADHAMRSREVGRLMREEGLTMSEAARRMGFQ